MKKHWMFLAVLTIAGLGTVAIATAQSQESTDRAAEAATYSQQNRVQEHDQPIAFPHNVHAGTYQIECAYCHYSAERSPSAGLPPTSTCLGCHTQIAGSDEYQQTEIAKIREFADAGEQIPWVRIHKVADHVSFPHHRHVNAGLDCTVCHGDVQNKGVWVEPDGAWGEGKMGWCISCHVELEVNRDCTVCHY